MKINTTFVASTAESLACVMALAGIETKAIANAYINALMHRTSRQTGKCIDRLVKRDWMNQPIE
jgi:hypothetical protein